MLALLPFLILYAAPLHTTSVGDSGALSASAISCALWLTLGFLVLIVLIASVKLFCRPCLCCCELRKASALRVASSRRGSQRSLDTGPFALGRSAGAGLWDGDENPGGSSSIGVGGRWFGSKAGNLKVVPGGAFVAGEIISDPVRVVEAIESGFDQQPGAYQAIERLCV